MHGAQGIYVASEEPPMKLQTSANVSRRERTPFNLCSPAPMAGLNHYSVWILGSHHMEVDGQDSK